MGNASQERLHCRGQLDLPTSTPPSAANAGSESIRKCAPMSPDKRELFQAANEILRSGWSRAEIAQRRRLDRQIVLEKRRRKIAALAPNASSSPAQRREPSGVYVVGSPGGPIKIGISADISGRLRKLQTGSAERLKVYLFLEPEGVDVREVERECHRRLISARLAGEWFAINWRDATALVRRVTDELSVRPIIQRTRIGARCRP